MKARRTPVLVAVSPSPAAGADDVVAGERFLLLKEVDDKNRSSIGVIFNWPALLTASRP